jgi:hypothetical protein
MSVTTIVDRRPQCDMCRKAEAQFDAKTIVGSWAYMCLPCYKVYGIGLGTGKGQRLYLASEVRDDDETVDPLHPAVLERARHSDAYDPEQDYLTPTRYDIIDGEV